MNNVLTNEEIKFLAASKYDWAVTTRRELHKIPEEGFKEIKTKRLIAQKLSECGIDYTVDERGWITAFIKGAFSGPVTGFRADIDALPVTEPAGCPFGSTHPGYMHACGHDMHTAIMLAAGSAINDIKDRLHGGVKLMFQPAEETDGGAKPMTENGVMENPHVDRVYGLHVMPRLVVGQVECRPGTLNAGINSVTITVNGTAAHGAYPENGCDAIVCACQLVCALQTLVARNVSPLESAVLTIGVIEGGKASNIICDRVTLKGTLRTANPILRSMLIKRITEASNGVCAALGCSAEVLIEDGYAPLVNSKAHSDRVLRLASRLFGSDHALVKEAPSMGGEDFSYFLEKAPGAFFHVGCSSDAEHIGAGLHSEKFAPDERAMLIGTMMDIALAFEED